jgi:hypothetical protein
MQPFRKLRWHLAYAATGLVLLWAMPRGAAHLSADPHALFEQLGGTEVPNPVFDNMLTIARETLAILVNMIPG